MDPDLLNQFSLLENAVKEDRRVQYGDMLQNFYSIRAIIRNLVFHLLDRPYRLER